jgi:ketosteroid isomerase-like protein
MSQENVEIVRRVYDAWERGDCSSAEWAHPEIEFVLADGPQPALGPVSPGWQRAFAAS